MKEGNNIPVRGGIGFLSAWGLSFGCAVGWGAFVMPGTTFLPVAGPLGTLLGILLGALVMLLIGINYNFLMQRYPDSGGAYGFVKRICNYDHGFLCAWFLVLVYIAITWSNATAIALIGRNLLGGLFKFGFHYNVLHYDIYLGEFLVAVASLALVAFIFCRFGTATVSRLQAFLAILLLGGVAIAFAAVMLGHKEGLASLGPAFESSGNSSALQILSIVGLAPWAFVGFESISHTVEDFSFKRRKTIWVIIASLVTSAFAYVALTLIAVARRPDRFYDWIGYVADLWQYEGRLEGLPVFYSVEGAMGRAGLVVLGIAALAAIFTGIIGNLIAASRLVHSMAKDGLLPRPFAVSKRDLVPVNVVIAMVLLSCGVLLFGRTAIGWIVDVTSVGAGIVYGYVSYCAFVRAKREKKRFVKATGIIGLVISVTFVIYFMVPNFWSVSAFATESYLILAAWGILGFMSFRKIFRVDQHDRFGKSTVVWLVLLFLVFFASLMWVRQATHGLTGKVVSEVGCHYEKNYNPQNAQSDDDAVYLKEQKDVIDDALTRYNLVQMSLVVITLAIMFNIYNTMSRKEMLAARAKSYFFSTVSHDIRTPLNAIIGFSQMLKAGFKSKEEQDQAVDSILSSGNTLLGLINDILDLSKLEAGRVEIDPEPTDCSRLLREITTTFRIGNSNKAVELRCKLNPDPIPTLLIDSHRLRQIAVNLIGNALKFTESGFIEARLSFSGSDYLESGTLKFEVEDTGVGISELDQKRIASPYVQVSAKTARHGGTGLGLAICKQLSAAMGGSLSLVSQLGKGSTFTVKIPNVKISSADPRPSVHPQASIELTPPVSTVAEGESTPKSPAPTGTLEGLRILIADDSKMNLMVLKAMLMRLGKPTIVMAEDGEEAWKKMTEEGAPAFDIVLTDMWMPKLDGEGLAKRIRAEERFAKIPVYVITADVELSMTFAEKGFDGIQLKPVTVEKLKEILRV
ncbi:MAG: amino acid permease [Lentisphaerae bacterium]|nr:amino acid permease [Lentisphaerota bacterium]